MALDFRAFAYYHPGYKRWITEDGEFDILFAASSTDIRSMQTVVLQSTLELPSILDRESTLREWLEDARGQNVLDSLYQEISDQMQANFGEDDAAIGMDPMGFLMDTPLVDLLHFLGDSMSKSPEEIVDQLLAEVHGTD